MKTLLRVSVLGLLVVGCGAVDESPGSDAVPNPELEQRYGPSATRDPSDVGEATLKEENSLKVIMSTAITLTPDGDIVVRGVPEPISTRNPSVRAPYGWLGDREIGFLVSTRSEGPQCVLGGRWRSLPDQHIGLLLTCSDGVRREGVLRPSRGADYFPGRQLTLAEVGGTRAGTPSVATTPIEPENDAPWDSARFWLER